MTDDDVQIQFTKVPANTAVALYLLDEVPDDYCMVGRTKCIRCSKWCALGEETLRIVVAGVAQPRCHQCIRETATGLVGAVVDPRHPHS